MYIKNAPTLYELRHSKYSCKKNKFNKSKLSLIGTVQLQEVVSNDHRKRFQSLIGTVQQILYESRTNAQWQNVSISHRYGPTGEPLKSMALGGRFQSLIGTVQRTFLGGDFMTLTIMFQSLIGTVQRSKELYSGKGYRLSFNLSQVRFNNSVYCVSCFHYTLFLLFFNLFKVYPLSRTL